MTDDILGDGERLLDRLNRQDCERARAKMASAPLTLTDHDFVVLLNYGEPGEDGRAYQARQAAQLAIVKQHLPAPLERKSAEPAPLKTKRSRLKRRKSFSSGTARNPSPGRDM